jgi:uncharacterized protein (DUF1778 family)
MPTTSPTTKQERLHIRLDSFAKETLERAAAYQHKSLSEFVISQSMQAAESIIEAHENILLPLTDWSVFLDALENPPEANTRLKNAFSEYNRRVKREG